MHKSKLILNLRITVFQRLMGSNSSRSSWKKLYQDSAVPTLQHRAYGLFGALSFPLRFEQGEQIFGTAALPLLEAMSARAELLQPEQTTPLLRRLVELDLIARPTCMTSPAQADHLHVPPESAC